MQLYGETNKLKITQLLLLCLQYGVPKGETHTFEDLRKSYKFENIDDFKRLRSCIDLLEDTEYAIISFCEYKLSSSRKNSLGEKYLRLYGLLNAVYLQKQAIIEIAEIVKFVNKKAILRRLNSHKALEIRNVAGAHTVNYFDNDSARNKSRTKYFRLTQIDLNDDACRLTVVGGNNHYEEINLKDVIFDYCELSEKLSIEIVEKYIKTLCKRNTKNRDQFLEITSRIKLSPTNYGALDKLEKVRERQLKRIKKLISLNDDVTDIGG